DRVQLPRIYLNWITPALYAPGDAELDIAAGGLAGGKTSRLYKRLVYDMQLPPNGFSGQGAARYGPRLSHLAAAPPSSDPPEKVLERIKAVIDEEMEKLRNAPPDAREIERVRNGYEAGFFSQMERVASKADQLNAYYFATGNPDYFAQDFGR